MRILTPRSAPWLFLSPFLLSFACFGLYPIARSLWLAFFITAGPQAQVWVGWGNFAVLFRDPSFWKALSNTGLYALASVLIQLPVSLGLALLLDRRFRGRTAYRFAFFSPHLMGTAFAAILFAALFAPKVGLWNRVLHALFDGEGGYAWLEMRWLGDAGLVLPALILVGIWLHVGFNMIYFLAALQSVDREQYEAARIDGAGAMARFWHVTLPAIRPVAMFVVVLSTLGSFNLYELPWLLLNNSSGPDQAGLTLIMYLFQNGFLAGDLGYASAVGWTLAMVVTALALLQLRAGRRRGEEA